MQDYWNIITQAMQATNSSHTIIQEEIFRVSKQVITTNFDNTFEKAFRKLDEIKRETLNQLGLGESQKTEELNKLPQLKLQFLPNLDHDFLSSGHYGISYIHRSDHRNTETEYIILKTDDYENFYPSINNDNNSRSDVLENFIREIYDKKKTLLFIGFSLKDPYFRQLLHDICAQIKHNEDIYLKIGHPKPQLQNIQHYALLQKPTREPLPEMHDPDLSNQTTPHDKIEEKDAEDLRKSQELIDELEALKIDVIQYDKHCDCEDFLGKIRENKNSFKR